ncbi:hypothetical protein [Butyrivibrio virus Ceridwen]|nr:hypothetical protein [Butyrivibrio virus Ceridwen]
MRKFKVYVVNSDTIIVDADRWEITDPSRVVFYQSAYGEKVAAVFNLDNIQGFKEVK